MISFKFIRSKVNECIETISSVARLNDEIAKPERDDIHDTAIEVKNTCAKASKIADDNAQFRKLKEDMRKSGLITHMGIQQALPVLINSHFDDMRRERCYGKKENINYYKNLKTQGHGQTYVLKHTCDSFSWKKPKLPESNIPCFRRDSVQFTVAKSA